MNALILPATRSTPGIWFEPASGRFELTGNSIPENASEFYQPVIAWLANNLPDIKGQLVMDFHLSYFNSTSLKAIYQLLKQIKAACTLGVPIRVRWYAEDDDELLVETVAMLSEMLDMQMDILPAEDDSVKAVS